MRKAVIPICVILFIMFVGCYLIIMEYAKEKAADRAARETVSENVFTDSISENDGIQGILLNIEKEDLKMTFQDIKSGKTFEIPFDNNLEVRSKYAGIMSIDELEQGEIYRLFYTRSLNKLTGLQVSDTTWTYTDVTRFSFDEKKKVMMIGDEAYKFSKDLRIYSLNKEAQIMDITEMDTLTVRGLDKEVLSVVVDKGHGYIRVLNDAYFVGGWIEIGQDIIKPITEDMLIPAGEGDHLVRVTNRGYAGEEQIKVVRDKESRLDLSKIDIEEVAIGHVQFKIEPDYARLYIDDEITEFEDRVPIEYGVHAIRVECVGYRTIYSNIKVGSDYAEIEITMDEEDADTSSSSSSSSSLSSTLQSSSSQETVSVNTVSTNSASTSHTTSSSTNIITAQKKIQVQQPSGAEVYLDGNYIGIAPASTPKVTGSHVITLSRDGYRTKSYTVNIANDGNDVTFSFSDLMQE